MFLCIRVTKSVLPEFCRSCKVIFCSFFADEDGWEAEKPWNSVESGFLCQKCCFFTKSQRCLGENVPLDMNLAHSIVHSIVHSAWYALCTMHCPICSSSWANIKVPPCYLHLLLQPILFLWHFFHLPTT